MLDRKSAPPFVRSDSFELIKPVEELLPGGVKVFFVPGGSQEVLKIECIYEAGRWFENTPVAAYFASQLVPKGTARKSSFQIATIFDQYGAHLEISPGLDFVSIAVYALTKNLSPVFELFTELLTEASFPPREYDLARSVFLQNLKVNNEKNSYVASQVFRKNLYGAGHPYGLEVTEEHVEALALSDIKSHFQRYHRSPVVFVSGKISGSARDLIVKGFSSLGGPRPVGVKTHQVTPGPGNEHIEKKESIQSSIRAGKRSVLRAHADYVPILFVSHILGGYFGSRLMKNLREEKGLTYGIHASIHGLRHDAYLLIGADVNKENRELAFNEIRKELKVLRTSMISQDELETTCNHFIGSLQSEMTTPFAHADKLKTIYLYDLQPDHYQSMIRRIDAMTASAIAETSERYFQEDDLFQLAVG